MELVRLDASVTKKRELERRFNESLILFHCVDADTVLVAASMADEIVNPFGLWLEVSDGYRAQLVARDVATLSHLSTLAHVVLEAERASEHAEVVRALLVGGEVNFSNDVATLEHAYNRPPPARDIKVWSYEDDFLKTPGQRLRRHGRVRATLGDFTHFS